MTWGTRLLEQFIKIVIPKIFSMFRFKIFSKFIVVPRFIEEIHLKQQISMFSL